MSQPDQFPGPQFNLTGGPSGATAATLAALGSPIMNHLDPACA
jgi:hypothetical protein